MLLQNSISPIQQYSYTYGKNSTDSAMIIDAMDILYSSQVEGFCIVSSDSDFTRLAGRLRESGMTVIGMGPFRTAFDIFTTLELLLEDSTLEKEEKHPALPDSIHGEEKRESSEMISKSQIEEAVIKIITENQNNDKETRLAEVGNRLVKLYPDFDVRRYGYSMLYKFLETFPKLKVIRDGTLVSVTLYEDPSQKENLEEYIVELVRSGGKQGVSLGMLGNKIRTRFRDFKVRDYGYSQFKQYIQSIPNIHVREETEQIWAVYNGERDKTKGKKKK